MRLRGAGAAVTITLVVACASTLSAANTDPASGVLSPGTLARLAGSPGVEPEHENTWRLALGDPRPEVRAAAARGINVSAAVGMVPDLKAALASEVDSAAAAEMSRALVALSDAASDASALEAAIRIGGDVSLVVSDALGRTRGRAALGHLSRLRPADPGGWARRALVRAVTRRGHGDLTPTAVVTLRESDPVAWDEVLTIARERGALDPGVLAASLSAEAPAIRAATYWHLAVEISSGRPVPELIAQELARAREEDTAGDDLDARFGWEVLGRTRGREPHEQAAWRARLRQGEPLYFPRVRPPSFRRFLTSDEWNAGEPWIMGGVREDLRVQAEVPSSRRPVTPYLKAASPVRYGGTFPRGYATGLLDVTGCKPGSQEWVACEVTYGPDGRPRQVGLPKSLPKGCEEMVRLLAVSSLAPLGHFEGETTAELLLLPLARPQLSCLEAESPGGAAPRLTAVVPRGRERVIEPKKTKDVRVVYPDEARVAGFGGEVEAEALIGRTGCVHQIRSTRGPRILAVPLIQAASQWRYTPVVLDGTPAETPLTVRMQVEVR